MAAPWEKYAQPKAASGPWARYQGAAQPSEPEYDPTEDMSTADKFFAGMGKAFVDTGRGIKQLGAEGGNLVGLVSDDTVQRLRQEQDEISRRDAPLMRTGAGRVGNLAGQVALSAVPAGAVATGARAAGLARTAMVARAIANPTTYRAATAVGALQGAVQPVGSSDSRAANVGAGATLGFAGNAAANLLGRIAHPIRRPLPVGEAAAVRALERAGVPLDAAQRSGNRSLRQLRAGLQSNPVTAERMGAFKETQQTAFNRAVLREMGEQADAATPDVMSRAAQRIGSYFDAVQQRVPLKIDAQLGRDVQHVMQGARDTLLPNEYATLDNLMGVVQQRGGYGALTGQQYQRVKRALDQLGTRPDLGLHARSLREAFDAALQRSARGTTDYQLLKEARRQWAVLKTVEDAVARNEVGHIMPARLFNELSVKRNRSQSIYGRGANQRLVRIAAAGKRVLKDLPTSGTSERMTAQLAIPAVAGAGYGVMTGDWESAAKLTAGAAALTQGSRLITSRGGARYLSEGMRAGPVRNALTVANRNSLAGSALRQAPGAIYRTHEAARAR